MDKLGWCWETKNGFEMREPNANLAQGYIEKAKEALESMHLVKSRDWKISTAYYTLYFSLYAILMQIGISSEIHTCTIEFMRRHLCEYFTAEDIRLVDDAFDARSDAQYYINKKVADETVDKMLRDAPRFLARCKAIVERLDERQIQKIRTTLETRHIEK